jgi:ribosomal protein L28
MLRAVVSRVAPLGGARSVLTFNVARFSGNSQGQRLERADRGLWAGKRRIKGNNCPKSKKRTRREWSPNVFVKRLWSEILGRFIRIPVTAEALRMIDGYGGIDNYLLKSRDEDIDSKRGLQLKAQMKHVITHRKDGKVFLYHAVRKLPEWATMKIPKGPKLPLSVTLVGFEAYVANKTRKKEEMGNVFLRDDVVYVREDLQPKVKKAGEDEEEEL